MVRLSDATLDKVYKLFPNASRAEVVALLENECSDNLPLYAGISDPQRYERVQFAVLKLSEGDFSKLRRVIDLAKRDWRDVLMGACFGDPQAHKRWHVD